MKRSISWILVIAMVLSLLSQMSMPTFAEQKITGKDYESTAYEEPGDMIIEDVKSPFYYDKDIDHGTGLSMPVDVKASSEHDKNIDYMPKKFESADEEVTEEPLAYAVEGGNIYFDKANGAITDADEEITVAIIPAEIDGVSVEYISGYAFANCRELKSVTIPGNVTTIGDQAFEGCAALTSVTIPNSVTTIERSAFGWCGNLQDVYYAGTEEMWNAIRIDIWNEDLLNATIHFNCTSENPETVEIKIHHSLNLASDIAISYVIATNVLAPYDSYTMECTVPIYEGNELVGTNVVTLQPELRGEWVYFVLDGLSAVEMNNMVDAQLHLTKNGTPYVSATDQYGIATYAYSQLNGSGSSEALRSICAELLRYGAKAQIYKGYRTASLADEKMTEEHKTWLKELNSVTFGNTNVMGEEIASPTVTWEGKTLNLESKIMVVYVVNVSEYDGEASDLCLKVGYLDCTGEKMNVTLRDPQPYGNHASQYAFYMDSLLAAEMRTVLTAQVFAGETPVSNTLTYSADTYGKNKIGVLGELCKALFAYSDSAQSFFGGNTRSDEVISTLEERATELGYENAMSELTELYTVTLDGDSYYRVQQNYQGIPVYGRMAIYVEDKNGTEVGLQQNLEDVSSELDLAPSVTEQQVKQCISAHMNEEHSAGEWEDMPEISLNDSELFIYNLDGPDCLVYEIYVGNYRLLVDAHTGEVVNCVSISNNDSAILPSGKTMDAGREKNGTYVFKDEATQTYVYTANNKDYIVVKDNGTVVNKPKVLNLLKSKDNDFRTTADNTPNDADFRVAENVLQRTNDVRQFFDDEGPVFVDKLILIYNDGYSRSGGKNGRGGYGKVGSWIGSSLYDGSGKNEKAGLVDMGTFYCKDTVQYADVFAHEYTHAVSNAVVQWGSSDGETGALDEAYSDIFGELYQAYLTGKNPDWIHCVMPATSSVNEIVRNIKDPKNIYGYPTSTSETYDKTSRYSGTTIISHIAYKLFAGNPNIPGSAISLEDLTSLWYKSMLCLPPTADFSDCQEALLVAADILSLSAAQKAWIQQAFYEAVIPYDVNGNFKIMPYDAEGKALEHYSVSVVTDERVEGQQIDWYFEQTDAQPLSLSIPDDTRVIITICNLDNPDQVSSFMLCSDSSAKVTSPDTPISFYTNFVATVAPTIKAEGWCNSAIKWSVDSKGTLTLLGTGTTPDYAKNGVQNQPWLAYAGDICKVVVGSGITNLGWYNFSKLPKLTEVVLPNTLKHLGYGTFVACTGLEKIDIPASVTRIGWDVFYDCYNLRAIYFYGEAPYSVGTNVFHNVPSDHVIYYIEGSRGWTSPTWKASGQVHKTAVFVP